MDYRAFIKKSLNNVPVQEKEAWLDHKISILQRIDIWEEEDKEIYMILTGLKKSIKNSA